MGLNRAERCARCIQTNVSAVITDSLYCCYSCCRKYVAFSCYSSNEPFPCVCGHLTSWKTTKREPAFADRGWAFFLLAQAASSHLIAEPSPRRPHAQQQLGDVAAQASTGRRKGGRVWLLGGD